MASKTVSKRAPILVRLAARCEVTADGCWRYTGAVNSDGYGTIGFQGSLRPVHRVVYELLIGPISDGYVADHLCHNSDPECSGGRTCLHRRCFNPAHIEMVPPRINNGSGRQGAYLAARTHCPSGHAYAEFGVRYPSGGGRRECRECKRLRSAAYYLNKKAGA